MNISYIPRVVEVQYLHDYFIHVVFTNGKEGTIDLSSFIGEGIFKPLSNAEYFKKVFADGWTISWPNGADIAPETLYELTEITNDLVNEKLQKLSSRFKAPRTPTLNLEPETYPFKFPGSMNPNHEPQTLNLKPPVQL